MRKNRKFLKKIAVRQRAIDTNTKRQQGFRRHGFGHKKLVQAPVGLSSTATGRFQSSDRSAISDATLLSRSADIADFGCCRK